MATIKAEPLTLPAVFYADNRYRVTLAALTVLGFLGSDYVSSHQPKIGILFWAMTGLYLLLLALMLSLRIQIDSEGILQRWLFSGVRVPWKQIARMDRTPRGYRLIGNDGKEQILLVFLAPSAQQAIAQQVVQRARLRPCAVPPKPPTLEQWERKK
jgi:hypothetical protein